MPIINNRDKKLKALMKRQEGKCWLCGKPMARADITFDHIIPRSSGGGSGFENLKLAHKLCNRNRGSSMEDVLIEFNGIMALRHTAT